MQSSRVPLHYAAMHGNPASFKELVAAKNVPIKQMIDNKDKVSASELMTYNSYDTAQES